LVTPCPTNVCLLIGHFIALRPLHVKSVLAGLDILYRKYYNEEVKKLGV